MTYSMQQGEVGKKSQKSNPKKSLAEIAAKRAEIEDLIKKWSADLLAGKWLLYFVDESHLLWGAVCGYVWGRTDRRIEVAMMNEKQRQTYFGALNYHRCTSFSDVKDLFTEKLLDQPFEFQKLLDYRSLLRTI